MIDSINNEVPCSVLTCMSNLSGNTEIGFQKYRLLKKRGGGVHRSRQVGCLSKKRKFPSIAVHFIRFVWTKNVGKGRKESLRRFIKAFKWGQRSSHE